MKLLKFNDFVNEKIKVQLAGSGESEQVLADLWNSASKGQPIPSIYNGRGFEPLYNSIKKYAKGELKVFGSSAVATSKLWKDVTGKNKDTSKADVLGNRNYSVKKGPAQLMSGAPDEAIATFMAAAEISGLSDVAIKNVRNSLLNLKNYSGQTLGSDMDTGTLKKLGDANQITDQINKDAYDLVKKGTELQAEVKSYLEKVFAESSDFQQAFVYEAMTGVKKFSDRKGVADSLICINDDATEIKIEDISNPNSDYVKKVVKATKMSVNYKSGSYKTKGVKSGYRFQTAIRLLIGDLTKESENLLGDIESKKDEYGQLNEGAMDFIKNAVNKIKNIFSSIINAVQEAIDYISKGFNYLLSAFELEPEISGWETLDQIDLFKL
jgi:hypothetical protein